MIDLSCWNLTIPIGATVIPTAKLNKGYVDPYFKPTADFIDFIAPSDVRGAQSTPHSDFPRCELRFTTLAGAIKEANWKIASAALHVIAGCCAIMEGPRSGKLIFAQWHGDTNHPGFKGQATRQSDGTWNLYAQLRRKLDGAEDKVLIAKGVKQGEAFVYRFELTGTGLFKAFVNRLQAIAGALLKAGFQFDMESYANDTWYPKAGVYSQEPVGGKGRGWVRYFALHVYDGEVANAPQYGLPQAQPEAPVITPPASTPVPSDDAPARSIADLSEEIRQVLADFKAGRLAPSDALDFIQAKKVEADTHFPKTEERSAFYKQVTAAKEAIKAGGTISPEPAKPVEPTLVEQIASVFDEWAAGTMAAYDALLAMNAYSKQVAKIPSDKDRAPLYDQINNCKDRINGSKK